MSRSNESILSVDDEALANLMGQIRALSAQHIGPSHAELTVLLGGESLDLAVDFSLESDDPFLGFAH